MSDVTLNTASGAITLTAANSSGNKTLTLPAVSDTLVGKATTDTLTNKSIVATQLTGTIAAARLPTGSVLQVVNANYSTQVGTTSTSYVDTGLTATITPTSATSKILVIVDQNGVYADGSANAGLNIKLLRDATTLTLLGGRAAGDKAGGIAMSIGSVSSNYLDSPATTSATTYKTQFLSVSGAATAYVQVYQSVSTITLMEIAG